LVVVTLAQLVTCHLYASSLATSNALHEIRMLNQQSLRPPQRAVIEPERQAALANYRKLLADLATNQQALPSTPEERVLLRVARDVYRNPAQVDELLNMYGTPEPLRMRVSVPPWLQAPHNSEAYRAAWEALLLAPRCQQIDLMAQRGIITQALGAIGSTDSIPVLDLAFAFTCEPGVDSRLASHASDRQSEILFALTHSPSQESLRTILSCLERAEATQPASVTEGKNVSSAFTESLVRLKGSEREKWHQILNSFAAENLSPKQREILNRAVRREQESTNRQ
jgi:hypothetical protein